MHSFASIRAQKLTSLKKTRHSIEFSFYFHEILLDIISFQT